MDDLPHAMSSTNCRDVVAVALAFAGEGMSDRDLLIGIMRALKGMSNPAKIEEEIKRQRIKP